MSQSRAVCERCGKPAIVHIGSERATEPIIHHFCIPCAEIENATAQEEEVFLDGTAILVVIGLYILLISAFADEVAFGGHAGFGWKQIAGTLIGVILVGAGAATRIPTLVLIGLITGSLTIVADWVGYGSHPGFGFQQQIGSILGLGMMLYGLIRAWRRK